MVTNLLNADMIKELASLQIEGRIVPQGSVSYITCSDGSCYGNCVGGCEGTAAGGF